MTHGGARPTDDARAGPAADPADLELTPSEMTVLGRDVLDRVVAHLASLDEQPACGDVQAEALCRSLDEAQPPEQGESLDALLAPLFDEWVGRSFTTPGPGYLAYIPGGGLFPAALADLIADATNRFTGMWRAAPALVQLEANVLRWFAGWMGFPATTRGLLTSGGSLANFSAVVCAREKLLRENIRAGVLYTSSQAHLSVTKAARLAGVLDDRVRSIPVDRCFRMRTDALEEALDADRAAGLHPFMVVTSAGTTNTGAVDPLAAVGKICRTRGLWHHVDGAYGAFFHACPDLRGLLAGLSRADSVTLDPHKGLFLPYGTGALLVADGAALKAAHGGSASYLPDPPEDDGFYDPSQYGPELSRDFRGLRVWLCVKFYGAARLLAALAEKRVLAVTAAEQVAALPGVVMDAPPQLSLFAFHLGGAGTTVDQQNRWTRALLERVLARQRVMLTGCTIDGRFLARVCVLSFRTRRSHMKACVEDIAAAAKEALGGAGGRPGRASTGCEI